MDHAGFAAFAQSDAVGRAALAAAEIGAREGQRRAPKGKTGEFSRSFEARQSEVIGGRRNERRAGAVLINTSPYAQYVMKDGINFMNSLIPIMERG